MTEPTPEEKIEIALAEFTQISNVLAVPTLGKPLPDDRKWALPCPDRKALADHPEASSASVVGGTTSQGTVMDKEVEKCLKQTSSPSEERKAGESYVQESPTQTRRK